MPQSPTSLITDSGVDDTSLALSNTFDDLTDDDADIDDDDDDDGVVQMADTRRKSTAHGSKSSRESGSGEAVGQNASVAARSRPVQPKTQHVIPFCTQRIPCNVTSVVFVDLDNDGDRKIVFGGSDRHIYVYKVSTSVDNDAIAAMRGREDPLEVTDESVLKRLRLMQVHQWSLSRQVHSLSVHLDSEHRETLLVGLVSGGYALITSSRPPNADIINRISSIKESQLDGSKLIYTVTLKRDSSSYSLDGEDHDDDDVPGDEKGDIGSASSDLHSTSSAIPVPSSARSDASGVSSGSASYSPSALVGSADSDASSTVRFISTMNTTIGMPLHTVPNLRLRNRDPTLTAFAGMDGKLVIQRPLEHEKHLRREPLIQLDLVQEVLTAEKVDMTGDGYDELVVATWDGVTYIIDGDKNIAFFNLKERLCGFRAGMYSLSPTRRNVLCFFYATFDDQIVMYSDVTIESVPAFTMLNSLQHKLEKQPPEVVEKFSQSISTVKNRYREMRQRRYVPGRRSSSAPVLELELSHEESRGATHTSVPNVISRVGNMVDSGLIASLLYEWDDQLMDSYLQHLRRRHEPTRSSNAESA